MKVELNFWAGGEALTGESLLFIREAHDQRPTADCLFEPVELAGVRDPYKDIEFEQGRDFVVIPGERRLELPEGSRIPFLKRSLMYSDKKHRMCHPHLAGRPETFMLFYNGPGLIRMQPELTYSFKNDWNGFHRPAPKSDLLSLVKAKLRDGAPLRLTFIGDSITAGMHASSYFHIAPFREAYPERFAKHLRENWGSRVTLTNLAVVGWTVGAGLERLSDRIKASRPDLAVIAYGMNDLGYRDPERFIRDTHEMMRRFSQANPATEFILVAPMTRNPEWLFPSLELSLNYRDALRILAKQTGAALLDMTTPWMDMVKRKAWISMSGNGLNHPNDFGHWLYAERLKELIAE